MRYLGFLKNKEKDSTSKKEVIPESNWPDHVINLDNKNFDDFIKKYPLSVVDFWAPWCNPCKSMAARLRRLSKIYKGKVVFGKIDIQKNENVSKKYNITSIPHLVFFNYGKKISSVTGLKSVGHIRKVIEDILKKEQ